MATKTSPPKKLKDIDIPIFDLPSILEYLYTFYDPVEIGNELSNISNGLKKLEKEICYSFLSFMQIEDILLTLYKNDPDTINELIDFLSNINKKKLTKKQKTDTLKEFTKKELLNYLSSLEN